MHPVQLYPGEVDAKESLAHFATVYKRVSKRISNPYEFAEDG
jgi:hypothetical protein